VRINQLSLALLHLFGRPLPEVLRDAIMRPIGASDGWQWAGYDDAWLEVDGRRVQSVPGGTHWGAGLSISARDQARLAQLVLQGGSMQWLADRARRLDSSACTSPARWRRFTAG
jgi:CubicO group peptidase (beta-lactamase class C family)